MTSKQPVSTDNTSSMVPSLEGSIGFVYVDEEREVGSLGKKGGGWGWFLFSRGDRAFTYLFWASFFFLDTLVGSRKLRHDSLC